VSLICCFHAERGKAYPDTAAIGGEREHSKQHDLRGIEYRCGWCAGGPARSSGEVPAWRGGGGAKGPDHLWLVCCVNRGYPGGTQ
jgi:hypothetical protein